MGWRKEGWSGVQVTLTTQWVHYITLLILKHWLKEITEWLSHFCLVFKIIFVISCSFSFCISIGVKSVFSLYYFEFLKPFLLVNLFKHLSFLWSAFHACCYSMYLWHQSGMCFLRLIPNCFTSVQSLWIIL